MRISRTRTIVATVAAILCAAGTLNAQPAAGQPTRPSDTESLVRTPSGRLHGTVEADYRIFKGIRYGMPPVGRLRWRPAKPPVPWPGVKEATAPGPICPQLPAVFGGEPSTNEDCLFLNVTTPRVDAGAKRKPVLVWIHGAGTIGSGDVFDASRLAAEGDLVVVTINYRMGLFGGFGHPRLKDSGTLGLQDQRAALRWVRRNIAAFGGDPGNVSLFGVSFGATAVAAHTMSPGSRGLFDKVIMHSGFPTMDAPDGAIYRSLGRLPVFGWKKDSEARDLGEQMATYFGCDGEQPLKCLRAIPAARILEYPQGMSIFQTYAYGNKVLPGLPEDLLRAGKFAGVPVLAGSTRDEHRTFVAIRELTGDPIQDADYPAVLAQAFGDKADEVAAEYPLSDYESARVAFASVMTDRMWAKSTQEYLGLYARKSNVYSYEFNDQNPPPEFPFPEDLPSGAYHNSDISYLLRSPAFEAQLSAPQRALSTAMIKYWSAFAHTGRPAVAGLPAWPRYNSTGYVQSLAPGEGGIRPVDYASEHHLEFWKHLGDS